MVSCVVYGLNLSSFTVTVTTDPFTMVLSVKATVPEIPVFYNKSFAFIVTFGVR